MSPRSWAERIEDILEAIAEIQAFTHGMDFDTFQGDAKTIKAVQLDFIVIGEAVREFYEFMGLIYDSVNGFNRRTPVCLKSA